MPQRVSSVRAENPLKVMDAIWTTAIGGEETYLDHGAVHATKASPSKYRTHDERKGPFSNHQHLRPRLLNQLQLLNLR